MARKYMTLRRYGGKARMASWIMPVIEKIAKENDLHTLVDVFGGGGTIALAATKITDNKGNPWFEKIYYNDNETSLVTLMRVLKDANKTSQLVSYLGKTAYTKSNWTKAHRMSKKINAGNTNGMSDIDIAWAHFVNTMLSRDSAGNEYIKPKVYKTRNILLGYKNKILELPKFTRPLQQIEICEMDYIDLLTKVNREHLEKEAVLYLDPPYIQATRAENAKNVYTNEMDMVHHLNVILSLLEVFPYWVLSGYEHSVYTDEIAKYSDIQCKKKLQSKSTSNNGAKGLECLWYRG